ncbi:proteasome inhibitor PI31 subunit [Etheostoma cragini]|uniref:proteasome inhibitor PI31 subunit n=1 Tax=Etheostoma cragini TaxID=417921 RepID=UPI00155F1FE5|nr:proteasome inhibitor PI31 subunit [Etheostoma cragini]
MAGLEVLYTCVGGSITCPQDAVVCFVHWEMIKNGYRCIGSGDEARSSDKKSELLPADWSSNKELYSLRYKAKDRDAQLLFKAIAVDSTLIFNLMVRTADEPCRCIVKAKQVDAVGLLHDVDSNKFRPETLAEPPSALPELSTAQDDWDWADPMVPPFAAGGADLDPFGTRGGGGMIVDPLRSGYPRSGLDPSSGIPDILPPGAVPPGARFDPFGPPGRRRPGPDPDHMPPPGYDDMFM